MTNFGGNTAFVLLAKIKGKEDKVTEQLELADKTDEAAEGDEPRHVRSYF